MDTPVLNTKNFLDPSEEYILEMQNVNPRESREGCKLWFNADLLQWTHYYQKVTAERATMLDDAYLNFALFYKLKITPAELLENFSDYPQEDFNALLHYIFEKVKEDIFYTQKEEVEKLLKK
jgi:hypothetical protein